MEKYLFKYTTKGPDCSIVGLKRKRGNSSDQIDEIQDYLDCRTITPSEAAWRLLQFDIHRTDPAVERLHVHLPLENNVSYTEDDYLEEVIADPRNAITKLTAWFHANRVYPQARQHTYVEFPEHFTWYADGKYWAPWRNNRAKVGRAANVGPNEGETFYLRMFLHMV
uniref:Uncharacterized protein n=1 Tax=Arundo donax TaxID=35708 RepID=A0A0A9G5Q4_ARUDO